MGREREAPWNLVLMKLSPQWCSLCTHLLFPVLALWVSQLPVTDLWKGKLYSAHGLRGFLCVHPSLLFGVCGTAECPKQGLWLVRTKVVCLIQPWKGTGRASTPRDAVPSALLHSSPCFLTFLFPSGSTWMFPSLYWDVFADQIEVTTSSSFLGTQMYNVQRKIHLVHVRGSPESKGFHLCSQSQVTSLPRETREILTWEPVKKK